MPASDDESLTAASPRAARPFTLAWAVIGLSVLVVLIGARAIRFSMDVGPGLKESLRPILEGTTTLFLTSFTAFQINGVVIGLMLVPGMLYWPFFARRVGGELRMTGWVHFWAWVELVLNQHFFDINRFLAPWFVVTLPLVWLLPAIASRVERPSGAVVAVGWLAAAAIGSLLAPSNADVVGLVAWSLVNVWLHRLRIGRLERLGLTVLAIPFVQLLVVSRDVVLLSWPILTLIATVILVRRIWPRSRGFAVASALAFPVAFLASGVGILHAAFDHGGRPIGDGLAYSFCETPDGSRVVAAVPMCPIGGTDCQDGHLLVYDPERDWAAERIDVFPEEGRFGRLEQVVCMEAEFQIGMCCVTDGDERREEDVLRVSLDGAEPEFGYRGKPLTRRLVWDVANETIYYVGEYVRVLDRRTGRLSEDLDYALEKLAPGFAPQGAIFTAEWGSLHTGRNSVYISEFARGSRIYVADRDTGEVSLLTDAANGGVLGVTVDEPLDRLYVNSLYGIDVYDLATGSIVATLRTGTLARVPVIDERWNLLYVPCTVGGRIEVFDRTTFDHLGAIAIGIETRNALLTRSGEWLVASEVRTQVAWPADELARRFRRVSRSR